MIDKTKFLEPTEIYLKENQLGYDNLETVKNWFNIDLIYFAMQFKNSDYAVAIETQLGYQDFCKHYNITLTAEELNTLFGDYPKDSFDKLVTETIKI